MKSKKVRPYLKRAFYIVGQILICFKMKKYYISLFIQFIKVVYSFLVCFAVLCFSVYCIRFNVIFVKVLGYINLISFALLMYNCFLRETTDLIDLIFNKKIYR